MLEVWRGGSQHEASQLPLHYSASTHHLTVALCREFKQNGRCSLLAMHLETLSVIWHWLLAENHSWWRGDLDTFVEEHLARHREGPYKQSLSSWPWERKWQELMLTYTHCSAIHFLCTTCMQIEVQSWRCHHIPNRSTFPVPLVHQWCRQWVGSCLVLNCLCLWAASKGTVVAVLQCHQKEEATTGALPPATCSLPS